jgi:hypothetical protein
LLKYSKGLVTRFDSELAGSKCFSASLLYKKDEVVLGLGIIGSPLGYFVSKFSPLKGIRDLVRHFYSSLTFLKMRLPATESTLSENKNFEYLREFKNKIVIPLMPYSLAYKEPKNLTQVYLQGSFINLRPT